MLDLEQTKRNATAKNIRLIDASPEALRECADRLEKMVVSLNPGESTLCELTPGIHVVHKPFSKPILSGSIETPETQS